MKRLSMFLFFFLTYGLFANQISENLAYKASESTVNIANGMDFSQIPNEPYSNRLFLTKNNLFQTYSLQTVNIPMLIPLPAIGLSRIIRNEKKPSSGYELGMDASLGNFLGITFYPILELKAIKLKYLTPKSNYPLYYGAGIGLSLPRILPVYFVCGKEFYRNSKQSNRLEISFSMSTIWTLWDFTDEMGPPFYKGFYTDHSSSIRFTYAKSI